MQKLRKRTTTNTPTDAPENVTQFNRKTLFGLTERNTSPHRLTAMEGAYLLKVVRKIIPPKKFNVYSILEVLHSNSHVIIK